MATIKGQNLRVFVGSGASAKCIAMATSCTFHISAELQDASTKDNTGDWQVQEVVGLSWDAQTESLVTLSDSGGELPQDILSLIINKTAVTLTFDQTAGSQNRVGQDSAIKCSGTAYVSDVNVTAQNRANSTLSVSFVGTGAISHS